MWRAKQEFKYIIDKTYSALQDVQESLNEPYKYLDTLNKVYKDKGKPSLTDIASAVATVSEYTDLMRGIDDEYKTEVLDKMEAMEQERIQLTERIKLLEKEKADLKEELKRKDQSLLDISHTIAKFNDSMEIFNTRVNSAVKNTCSQMNLRIKIGRALKLLDIGRMWIMMLSLLNMNLVLLLKN